MITAILFFICIAASTIGAIVGAGGGVIIKPAVDLLGLLPVSTVSFLSGCTVLAMSCSSLIRTRNNGAAAGYRISFHGSGSAAADSMPVNLDKRTPETEQYQPVKRL